VWQPWIGDGSIVADVTALANTYVWAKAGVMFRATLDANAAEASAVVSPARGVAFLRRPTTGGTSVSTGGSTTAAPPYWVRLERTGDVFTAYESADGTTWTLVGSETIAMPQTLYVGLAVSSHNNTTATTATVASVSVQ
jgi:regulation of enolase protein 1 (concanavalin A-like superfamily)